MKISKLEYSELRDRELLAAFHRFIGTGISINTAVRLAVEQPCSRYWTSPENAYKRISALRRGKSYASKGTREGRNRMFIDIMRKCGGDYSLRNIERVVYEGAPRFFLSAETAKRYIYRTIRNRRKCRGTSEK